MSTTNASSRRFIRLSKAAQPFLLVALGGILTLAAQWLATSATHSQVKLQAAIERRESALEYTDSLGRLWMRRVLAASDYARAVMDGEPEIVRHSKQEAYVSARNAFLIEQPILIARGHDFFGEEFKDLLVYKGFGKLDLLDKFVAIAEDQGRSFNAVEFDEAEKDAYLFGGHLIGVATRKVRDATIAPPILVYGS